MKHPFISYLMLIAVLLSGAASCGKKADPVTEQVPSDSVQKPASMDYYVWVDNLRARKSPGMEGEILMELKNGEKLVFLGEKSEFTEKVNLRGKDYEDFWLKVKLPNGQVGWVFGGAITNDSSQVISDNEWIIHPGTGVGKIRFGDDFDDLVKAYGKANVKKSTVYFAEGESVNGFVLFSDTPEEIECTYSPAIAGVDMIIIRKPAGKWHTADGIRNGMLLDSLVAMNGKPINFYGFGWDYGGTVVNYNGGRLQVYEGKLGLSLAEPSSIEGLDDFLGDSEFSTKDRRILRKGVKVAEMIITSGEAE